MNKKVGYIYQLTFDGNPHLRYIGQTTNIKRRILMHRNMAEKRFVTKNQRLVSMAWLAYGEPEVLVLAKVATSMLDTFERKFIKDFRTLHPHGLNVDVGGRVRR